MNKRLTIFALMALVGAGYLAAGRPAVMSHAGASPIGICTDDTIVKDSLRLPADSLASDTLAAKKDEKKKEEKKNEYKELTDKGGTVLHGLFTTRHIEDKWYWEVPDSMMGRLLLAVTRYTAVPQNFSGKFAGEEVSEATVYFERRDAKTLLLRAYVVTQLADSTTNISKTLRASTIDPIVAAFKVIGQHPDSTVSLIEVTPLFKNDNNLVGVPKPTATSMKLGGLQGDRTFVDTLKVFPINIEVQTTRTYAANDGQASRAGHTGFVTVGLNTSIIRLPDQPMRKRLWDERVGYFVSHFTQFTDDQHKAKHEAFISRHRLVPKDVAAYRRGILTEPVEPIVYYIDPATPKQWVPYLIQGINDWNVAFEAAGFKNAIQGREWPKDRPDMSVEDARYCVLRYLPAEIENAYGPCVVDPRSGEIIESHICWYHNVMNLLTKWYMVQCGPLDKKAQKMQFDEKLMGELIRFVSSHEVGHTLGLRHNMGASSQTPVEKLRDKKWVEAHGHTLSIMDYARFNYVAQPEDKISERGLFPRINDYDKWAIKWGYQYRPEFKDEFEEKEKLMTETTKVLTENPRLWFGGEGRDEDPRAQTEDLSDDNVKASEYGIRNLQRIIDSLPQWTAQPNGQYDDLKEMYSAVLGQFTRYTNHVLKHIGGHYLNNLPGREPIEVAPAETQQAVFGFLDRQLFNAPFWLYPQHITGKTGTDVINDITSRQTGALNRLMDLNTLAKIYRDSFTSPKAYQMDQYLDDLFAVVWKPLGSSDQRQDLLRRQLQRTYVANLNNMLNNSNNTTDVILYLQQHLNRVKNYCRQHTGSDLNGLHYADLMRQIQLIEDRQTKIK